MWLITPAGFYSIVEDLNDPRRLLVRARVRADLTRIPGVRKEQIVSTPLADYPYRASLTRGQVELFLMRSARRIKYPNFKDEVKRRQGARRTEIYIQVWSDLRNLESQKSTRKRVKTGWPW